jgi:hypothetical protein
MNARIPTATRNHPIPIDGELCSVNTCMIRNSWHSWGSFRDNHIRGTGATENAALTDWKKKANFMANA